MILFLIITLNSDVNKLYEEGRYFEVIEKADKALEDTNLTIEDKVGIHTILAFSYVALNKEKLAKLEFIEALSLKPDLELDPMLTSPKIIKVFKEAKELFTKTSKAEVIIPAKKRPKLYTLLIPGLPEIKSGNKKTGFFILGATTISIASWVFSYHQKNKYHQAYLDARLPQEINNTYSKYTIWYQINLATAGLCIFSYILSGCLYFF